MSRRTPDPVECLRQHWQVLLIASLPGSLLRIWAVLNAAQLAATSAQGAAAPVLSRLGAWSAEHGLFTLLACPLLTVAALLLGEAYGDGLPALAIGPRAPAPPPRPQRLDAMTAAARELLAAVSPRGEFRLVPRLAGAAVVASGIAPDDDREFYDPVDREVTQRYRHALAELERAGLIERDGEARRLSAMGWPAARLLTRQELDRIALRARHLNDPELRLLRLVAECQLRHRVEKVVLRRDGSAASVVYGNGQTVPVPGLHPLAATLADGGDDAAARFAALVAGIPDDYLALLPERRLGQPFVLRATDTGLRYLRYVDVATAVAA
ncbi:MAG: hypothetical protein U0802_15145 [Candidatus Binatia bacterium]